MNIRKIVTGLSLAGLIGFGGCSPRQKIDPHTYQYPSPFTTANRLFTSLQDKDTSQVRILIPPQVIDSLYQGLKRATPSDLQEIPKQYLDFINYLTTGDPELYPHVFLELFNIPKDKDPSTLKLSGLRYYIQDPKGFYEYLPDTIVGGYIGEINDSLGVVEKDGERGLPNYINPSRDPYDHLPYPDLLFIKENELYRIFPRDEVDYNRLKEIYMMDQFAYSPSRNLMAFMSNKDSLGGYQLFLSDYQGKNIRALRNITEDPRVQQGYMTNPVFAKDKEDLILGYYRPKTDPKDPPSAIIKMRIKEEDFLK